MSDSDYDYEDYDPQEFTSVLAGYAAKHDGLPGQRLYYRTRRTDRMRFVCNIVGGSLGWVRVEFAEGDTMQVHASETLYYDGGR